MLLPVTVLIRTNASDPPEERMVGINPEEIGMVEEGDDEGTVQVWCGGKQQPYIVRGTVDELIGAVNTLMSDEEES